MLRNKEQTPAQEQDHDGSTAGTDKADLSRKGSCADQSEEVDKPPQAKATPVDSQQVDWATIDSSGALSGTLETCGALQSNAL